MKRRSTSDILSPQNIKELDLNSFIYVKLEKRKRCGGGGPRRRHPADIWASSCTPPILPLPSSSRDLAVIIDAAAAWGVEEA
ncbi:hypothetical protein RRG08_064968 [Elysia crispata]|uniref:Uncharacterized protein n=1 Tax=Elysia crispata TaxID=231223 RepID=A0AAE0YA54_9GAST|nr:hypothetical protein RRG08_064968 [Elysia crispata]